MKKRITMKETKNRNDQFENIQRLRKVYEVDINPVIRIVMESNIDINIFSYEYIFLSSLFFHIITAGHSICKGRQLL